jgi:uncharacterized protein YhbP (UPF0306 family)
LFLRQKFEVRPLRGTKTLTLKTPSGVFCYTPHMDIEKVLRENIDNTLHLSLATVVENKPWVSEVHFAYDDELNLYYRSLSIRRHSVEITKNPFVAGSIVKQHAIDEYPLGIYFEGRARPLEAGVEQDTAFEILRDRLNVSDDARDEAARPDGHQFYKIEVSDYYVFGKLEPEGGKKYHLSWNRG